jgi:homoaconitase/3-isopropylmalate dehydratase large subunit
MLDLQAAAQVDRLQQNCAEFGIPLHGIGSPHQGIVHVIGPQLGLTGARATADTALQEIFGFDAFRPTMGLSSRAFSFASCLVSCYHILLLLWLRVARTLTGK